MGKKAERAGDMLWDSGQFLAFAYRGCNSALGTCADNGDILPYQYPVVAAGLHPDWTVNNRVGFASPQVTRSDGFRPNMCTGEIHVRPRPEVDP